MHIIDDTGGYKPFHDANGQVYRLHHQNKGAEGQFAFSRQKRLHDDRKSAELQGQNDAHDGGDKDPPGAFTVSHPWFVYERIDEVAGINTQVPDIAAEGKQTAVGEEERLDRQDRGHDEKGGMGSQEDGEDHPAAQVPARSRPGNREIDHLRSKNEGAEDPHQGDHTVVDPFLQFLRGIPPHRDRSGPQCRPHGGGK